MLLLFIRVFKCKVTAMNDNVCKHSIIYLSIDLKIKVALALSFNTIFFRATRFVTINSFLCIVNRAKCPPHLAILQYYHH